MDNELLINQLAMSMHAKTTGTLPVAFLSIDAVTRAFYATMARAAIDSLRKTHRMWRK